jgi:hypothetical protein
MAKKQIIDLGSRFRNAFGFVASGVGESLQNTEFTDESGIHEVYAKGNGSFEAFTIRGNGFELLFGNMLQNDSKVTNVFAPPPMISFTRAKKITATPIDDSDEDPTNDAEVVERYNSGKWELTIQGLLVDMKNHEFPKNQLTLLRQLFDVNAVFDVEGDWFDALNIKSIYTEDFSVSGVQGYEDTVQFTLKAYSIKPVEFFLKNT